MTEHWLPIVGYESEYEVSDLGRVRSLDRVQLYERVDQYSGQTIVVNRKLRGRLLKPGPTSTGHLTVCLRKGWSTLVHRLVLEAFIGPCPEGEESLHDDDVPAHNHLGNLRWGTRSDNLHDAVRNGKKPVGSATPQAKLDEADIPAIRAKIGTQSIASIGREFDVNESTIRQVASGRSWGHVL